MAKKYSRLTMDEKRIIIRLYEGGKRIDEITKETGRSREAVTGLLANVGLYEEEVINRAWRGAYDAFWKSQSNLNRKERRDYHNLSASEKEALFVKAKAEYLENAKIYYNAIMGENNIHEIEKPEPVTQENAKGGNLERTKKKLERIRGNNDCSAEWAIYAVLADIAISLSAISDQLSK